MYLLVFALIIIAVIFGPGIWVQRVLAKYAKPANRYAATGAQLARHLLNKNGLENVKVEQTLSQLSVHGRTTEGRSSQ